MPDSSLERAISQLFEPELEVSVAVSDLDADPEDLLPGERARIAGSAPKRQREFAAGRILARRLLTPLGHGGFALESDEDRVPLWPGGLVGSITHAAERCAVVVAARTRVRALGLDLEHANSVRPAVWRRTCTETERLRLEALPQARAVELGTWAFCAKEATYKCLYPQSRVWLGLRDVEVELDPEAGRFTAVPVRDVPPFASAGQELSGRLGALGERVFAALVLPA